MTNILDSPDNQRGIVVTGKLLATIAAGVVFTDVNLPPNARSLVVVFADVDSTMNVAISGLTTGLKYNPIRLTGYTTQLSATTYVAAVAPEVDAAVKITLAVPATKTSYVYAHNGVSVVAIEGVSDITQQNNSVVTNKGVASMGIDVNDNAQIIRVDTNGRQVPLVPTVGLISTVPVGTTQLIAAPASGAWYLFGIDVSITGGTTTPITLIDSLGNTICYDDPPGGGESHSINLSGFRTTGSVSVVATAGATVVLRYAPGP